MSKLRNAGSDWRNVAATLLMMTLAALNAVVLVLLLTARPEPFLLLLLRTMFALLLSLYGMYLTRRLQESDARRAAKMLTLITAYALVASAVFLWLVEDLPWWMSVTQWVTVGMYLLFGLVLASLRRRAVRLG